MTQIVKDNSLVSLGCQQSGNCAAYVPGTAGNQNFHELNTFPRYFGLNLCVMHPENSGRLTSVQFSDRREGGIPYAVLYDGSHAREHCGE
jgi:hypothetical protein